MYARFVMALREIPFGRIRPTPRYLDLMFEEAFDRTREDWIVEYERHGVPIRDILMGRMRLARFRRCGQIQLAINIMGAFSWAKENWTSRPQHFERMEENFARNLFNILVYVNRNIDWSVGGRPPIDRDSYETLKDCCDYETANVEVNDLDALVSDPSVSTKGVPVYIFDITVFSSFTGYHSALQFFLARHPD